MGKSGRNNREGKKKKRSRRFRYIDGKNRTSGKGVNTSPSSKPNWRSILLTVFSIIITIAGTAFGGYTYYHSIDVNLALADQRFQNGVDMYEQHHFKEASSSFEEAIEYREKAYDHNSEDLAKAYLMLGTSLIYGDTVQNDENKDISALNSSLSIYEELGKQYEVAYCYFMMAVAYFEKGYSHLNLAQDCIRSSTATLYGIEELQDALSIPWRGDSVKESEASNVEYPDSEMPLFTQPENYRALYQLCKFYSLHADIQNLLGKICIRGGDWNKSFLNFDAALRESSSYLDSTYNLVLFSDRFNNSNIEEEEIKEYISNSSGLFENTIHVRVLSDDNGEPDISSEETETVLLPSSTDVATYLTNRAMSEFSIGLYDSAKEDCEVALEIWDKYNYSDQTELPYTYIYLTLATIVDMKGADPEALNEKKETLVENLNKALSYSREIFGNYHPRTAYVYETKGFVNMLFNEPEVALNDYLEAYRIYEKNSDGDGMKFAKDEMNTAYDLLGSVQSFDGWFLANTR